MEENCQHGITKNHLPFHTMPWPRETSNKFENFAVKASLLIFCVLFLLVLFFLSFSQAVTRPFSFLIAFRSSRTGILAWFQYAKSNWIVCVTASCFVSIMNFSRWKYTIRKSCADGNFQPLISSFTDPTK